VHTIGMQFPIDIVYLNRRHRITKIRSSVPAWRLSICLCAHSVLELAAGAIRETQTERGDQLEFSPISVPSGNENSSSAEQVNKTNG
jgi:uncharacterized membrane protein (UPF0127 family)